MATEIRMPQLGESITEGTISRWLKRPGEYVEKYEPLLEVTTDKVDSEVPAPGAGTLVEIIVAEGETVQVGTVLARISPGAAAQASSDLPEEVGREPQPAPTPSGEVAAGSQVPTPHIAREAAAPPISPLVGRMVAEHGLDISQIPGTGMGGRVSKQDVLRYLEQRQQATPPAAIERQPVVSAQMPIDRESDVLSSSEAGLASAPVPADADLEIVPLTPLRRSIAEHMERSVRTAPHVTSVFEVDLTQIVAHRAAQAASFQRQGVRLTFTAYFAQASAAALREVPLINARYSAEGIVQHRRVHLGVAVALDDGLIVPVIRDADEKTLLGLARVLGDLAERARTRRLHPEETRGGTFTISNHGISGSLFATPIINQPQGAILGVGAIVKRPVVVSYAGQDSIAIRPMCYLSLTFDHRLIDGAVADAFLASVKRFLEHYD